MAGTLQPLDQKFPIVEPDGKPTLYFIRWAQQRMLDIGDAVSVERATEIAQETIDLFDQAHALQAGTGINILPDGRLSSDPTISADVQAILDQIATARGSVLFRGVDDWQALAPGTSGNVLQTNGAGADPTWVPQSGGGGGGSISDPGSFNVNPSQTASVFSADFFGGTPIYVPDTITVQSVKVFGRIAAGFATLTPAIYSSSAGGNLSTLIAAGPSVSGMSVGVNTLPLSAPISIPAGTFVFAGIVLTGEGISVARARAPASVFFSVFSSTPPVNPSASTGLSEWSSMWLGT